MEPRYLGDGVYAVFDGYHVLLRLGSHDNTTGQIALESEVFDAVKKFGNEAFKIAE